MACGLRELHAVSNESLVMAAGEVFVDVFENRSHKRRTPGVEGYQDVCCDVMASLSFQQIKSLEDLSEAVQRKETRIHRDDRFRASFRCVECEKTDTGRAIHDDVVILITDLLDEFGKNVLTTGNCGQFFRYRAEEYVGRSQIEVFGDRLGDVGECNVLPT